MFLALLRTADYGSDGRAPCRVPRSRSDCGTGCRTLSPTVGVLLFLLVLGFLLGLRLLLGGSRRWWRPRICRLCLP